MSDRLPAWAQEMRDLFKSGSVSQFILHGNIFDLVPSGDGKERRIATLTAFLQEVMFQNYDVILHYDRGKGIRAIRGDDDWSDWLTKLAGSLGADISAGMGSMVSLREPGKALEVIDRYLLRTLNLQALASGRPAMAKPVPRKIAVLIDFAEFVVPRGDPIQLSGDFSANIVKVLGWANDPAVLQSNIVTVLMTEGLHDLNELIVENPHSSKLKIPLPGEPDMVDYVTTLSQQQFPDLASRCEVPLEVLARRLTGLSRIGAATVISLALNNGRTLTAEFLAKTKKSLIERQCQGLLEFLESPFTLDNVAGHVPVKQWLREDARLLRQGALHALPMGYLITGRIGTGKTFLVQCWAGELGVPCVVFKNFRDRWVGATESNLEMIFSILHALGQVVVFVDEADQAAGKRDSDSGDSGLSGRVYGMLAKEMSDTTNRGSIIWVFATSRPDLLEVDLKRQGRLDVHIPLFPPQGPAEMGDLLLAVAGKLKFPLTGADLPPMPPGLVLGGNEIEGLLVRALRRYELAKGDTGSKPVATLKDLLADAVAQIRPNAYTLKLEYMDLVAVKECTDGCFLPEAYKSLTPEQVEHRIEELRRFV